MQSEHEHRSSGSVHPDPRSAGDISSKTLDEEVISVIDLAVALAQQRWFIAKCIAVFAVFGVVYSVVAPDQFESSTTIIREAATEQPSGFQNALGSLRGLGINLGDASGGLSPAAYPEILQSREVRLGVVRDTFAFPGHEEPMTFVDYVNQPPGFIDSFFQAIVSAPSSARSLFTSDTKRSGTAAKRSDVPTKAEEKAVGKISRYVSTSISDESGLMTIRVTAERPTLAADIAASYLDHLGSRIRAIRTEKASQNLEFVEERFEEAKRELQRAEERLADFTDRNQNLTSARMKTERERLQRQVQFKSELYGNLQTKLTQSRLELQRSEPALTVVEQPVPPLGPSNLGFVTIFAFSLVLGGLIGCVVAIVRFVFQSRNDEDDVTDKVEYLATVLDPRRLIPVTLKDTIRGNARSSTTSSSDSASS